jgi:hypothetical protein
MEQVFIGFISADEMDRTVPLKRGLRHIARLLRLCNADLPACAPPRVWLLSCLAPVATIEADQEEDGLQKLLTLSIRERSAGRLLFWEKEETPANPLCYSQPQPKLDDLLAHF